MAIEFGHDHVLEARHRWKTTRDGDVLRTGVHAGEALQLQLLAVTYGVDPVLDARAYPLGGQEIEFTGCDTLR